MKANKLTPTEREILMHRLESGCIADVLFESDVAPLDEAENAVHRVTNFVKESALPLEDFTRLELEVVEDCLDGSTYFADYDDAMARNQTTRSKVRKWNKAADDLEDAVSKAVGHPVVCARF